MFEKLIQNAFLSASLILVLTACGGGGGDNGGALVTGSVSSDTSNQEVSAPSGAVLPVEEAVLPVEEAVLPIDEYSFVLAGQNTETAYQQIYVPNATRYQIQNLPNWVTLNERTGDINMSPNGSQLGHELFDIIVTIDGQTRTIENGLRISLYKPASESLADISSLSPVALRKTGGENKTTSVSGVYEITNSDGINHTLITVYFQKYQKNNRITAIDMATNTVKSVLTENDLSTEGWNGAVMVPLGNGRAMFSYYASGKQQVSVYNTNTHQWDRNIVTPPTTHGPSINAITLSTDGQVFTIGQNSVTKKVTLLRIDPNTYSTQFYGDIGASQSSGAWAQQIAVDAKYAYVLSGRDPYELIQVRRSDGQQTTIPFTDGISIQQHKGGVTASGNGKNWYLYEGQQILKNDRVSVDAPWTQVAGECDYGSCFNVSYDNIIAADDRNALIPISSESIGTYWYQDAYKGPWKKITIPNIPLYPVPLLEAIVLPEVNKVLYAGDAYTGFLLQDMQTKDSTAYNLREGKFSYYGYKYSYPYIIMTGYPNGSSIIYDVTKPWDNTILGSAYKPDVTVATTNPKNIGKMNTVSGNHKNFSVTTGNDKKLYFAGRWMRDGSGSGVEWYDPITGKQSGLRNGFEDCWITQMEAVGDYIALGCSKISGSSAFEIRMFNTFTKHVDYVIIPDATLNRVGFWTKYGDENILIYTLDPANDNHARVLNINVITQKVVYNKDLEVWSNVQSLVNEKDPASIFMMDGFAYINAHNNVLIRLEPSTGDSEVVLKYIGNRGRMQGYDNVAYIAGDTQTSEVDIPLSFGFQTVK